MELAADPGLTLTMISAEAGSPDEDALRLLASWAATHAPGAASGIGLATARAFAQSGETERPRQTP